MGGDGGHKWHISDGLSDFHGYGVVCTRCNLELVPCVDLPPSGVPRPRFYIAGRAEAYARSKHRCLP